MRKLLAVLIVLFTCCNLSYGNHLKGGWIFYEYLGKGSAANTSKYRITVNQYLDCHSTREQIDDVIYLGIYDGVSNQLILKLTIPRTSTDIEQKTDFDPCITNPPEICYRIDKYVDSIELPDNTGGYTLGVQRCCRIDGIVNLRQPSNTIGVTYTTKIPGVTQSVIVRNNKSPVFAQKDVDIICVNSPFTFDFGATDADHDSLSYSFCTGLTGGDFNTPQPNPPSNPPFTPVTYEGNAFAASYPLGTTVSIDEKTGLISGTAPSIVGTYVVAVCASEFRNGLFIGETKKEIHIDVADCQLSAAQLKPSYITCDGFTFNFRNESPAANITSYLWDFGVPSSTTDTSTSPTPSFTYKDTGTYPIKLSVANDQGCTDFALSKLSIYPGFVPDFTVNGSCVLNPYQFIDATTTKYGQVFNWRWNFGDTSITSDTAIVQNPSYQYATSGSRNVTLIVSNTKGCTDTVYKLVDIGDKPSVNLPFHDTLICNIDTLQLQANSGTGTATFNWSPSYNIINGGSADPFVFPKNTTTYSVTVNDRGCINTDSVAVNVISNVQLSVGADTTICQTDSMQILTNTNALYFAWSPSTGLSDSSAKSPVASPPFDMQYQVVGSVGKCSAVDVINIKIAPYPLVNAGKDTTICFGKTTILNGTINAANFAWSPVNSLLNANTLTPLAGPQSTTAYVLTVTDNLGCPKPASDTVVVNVTPHIAAFAGHDTTIVAGQPLQMNASGGTIYTWSPVTGMDNPNIPNPIIQLGTRYDSMTYKVKVATPEGCYAYDDIKVIVFKTQPDIFVPSGFTPNGDGLNDILRPKVVGMKQFNYFKVFDRWGLMVYSTTQEGQGWDGTYSGSTQASGTYVFVAQAVDYTGKSVTKKGTVVLIR